MTTQTPDWDEISPGAKPKPKTPPPAGAGCLVVLFLSVMVLVASVFLGLQTRVGADLVADFLKRQTGLDLSVGGASLAWPLDLDLTDVQTKPTTTPLGSFKVREVRISWRTDGLVDLTLHGARLEVMKIADGWVPVPFARLGALADVRDTATLLGDASRLASLDVRDSSITWNGPDGERVTSADGVGISVRSLALGDRRLKVFEVTARNVRREAGGKGLNLRRLWLSGPANPYMEVEYSGIWEGEEGAARDWWSVPPGKTNRGMGHEK